MGDFQPCLELLLEMSVVAFIAGNLLAMGLEMDLTAGLVPRADLRFLGSCSRHLGAALAPLLVVPSEPRIMVMVAIAVPVTLLVTYLASGLLARRAAVEKR